MTSAMFCSDMTWPVGLPCTRIPAHIRPTALLTSSQEHSVRTGLMMQSARGVMPSARACAATSSRLAVVIAQSLPSSR